MGILSHKDIFNSKWITAEITDASNRIWYVPIKNPLGDYFLADIDNQVYCFKIDGARVKTYRHTLVKSFRVLQYDTNHYNPVSASDNKALENVLKKNSLPRVNLMLFNILKVLGKMEDQTEFKAHNLKELVAKISKKEDEYAQQVKNITNFLESLNVDEIVTPVKKVSEFLEDDLMETDAKFLGTIVSTFQRTDIEHRKVTNTPITGKIAWMKFMAVAVIIGGIAAVALLMLESGTFDSGFSIPGFDFDDANPFGTGGVAPEDTLKFWTDKYTPEELKAAIDRGEVDYDELPKVIQDTVDSVKLPEATPKQ